MSDTSLHRPPRLQRVAVWTAGVVLFVMGCMAGMPFLGLFIAEHAPWLLGVKAVFYSPAAYTTAIAIGAILAAAGSWARHRSVLCSVFAGLLSWAYVAYFAYTRGTNEYTEQVRRDRIAWRVGISIAVCGVALGWYVLAWVGVARGLNKGTISSKREPYSRVAFSPLIKYCDSNWPGSVSLTNFYYVVNPIQPSSGYALSPSYKGIRTSLPERSPSRMDRRPSPPAPASAGRDAETPASGEAAPRSASTP